MPRIPEIASIFDLRRDAAAALEQVRVEAHEAGEQQRAMLEALVRGEREISSGKGASLASVLREAGKLLDDE